MPTLFQPTPELKISTHIFRTKINGLYYILSPKHNDQRGFFSEIFKMPELEQVLGQPFNVKQMNYSHSDTKVVRGLHAEGWNKLVMVTHGLVFSALADIRPASPTFKQVEYFKLGFEAESDPEFADQGAALFITQGIANSVAVLQGPATYLYLVDKLYEERTPQDNQALDLFDPDLNIQWPFAKEEMILSARDTNTTTLSQLKSV